MRLKLPRHMMFHHDLHLMVFRPRGVMTEQRIDKDIAILEAAEDELATPFNRFTDVTQVDLSRLHFRHIFRISLHRRLKYRNRPPVKSAFYVRDKEAIRIVRTHALLTDHSSIRVRMFEELPDAAGWLGVSVEDLQMEA